MWDEPYLFKGVVSDGMAQISIPIEETLPILHHYYRSNYRGHYGVTWTKSKALQFNFYWPLLFKDSFDFIKHFYQFKKLGNISRRHEIPHNISLEVKLFDL